jgi:prephenate dehydrogenase
MSAGGRTSDGAARRVTIVGLGVIGGSLARALRQAPERPWVVGTARDPGDVARAEAAGVLDEVIHDAARAVEGADLVVYATPLQATLSLLEAHRERWGDDAVITDVVGLKKPVMEHVSHLGLASRFVGGHPVAGTEGQGFEGGRDGLFQDARVWLVPGEASPVQVARVEALWRQVGARPMRTDAATHDHAMVWCSQTPQLLANALAGALDVAEFTPAALGPGGRDMVRLAGSPPALWGEILAHSGAEAAGAVRSVGRALDALANLLEAGDIDGVVRFMDRTRTWKEG